MSTTVNMAGPVAFLGKSSAEVYFTSPNAAAGVNPASTSNQKPTAVPIQKLTAALEVAPWGEDNRFPQNIEQQMACCGIAKSALKFKAHALYGAGIVPGKIVDYEIDTVTHQSTEVFQPLKRAEFKDVYAFLEHSSMPRFWTEYFLDYTWYENCFPEIILDNGGTKITGLCHQESSDCRFKQMNDDGDITTVYLTKMWGMAKDQYAKFDPTKRIKGLIENPQIIDTVDNKYIKALDCIDMYDKVASLKKIAVKLKDKSGLKSAILPVNYPSHGKTYYQVPAWDGARLAGWPEIASKIPGLIKTLYNKAIRIKYHIEIPSGYFPEKFGPETWDGMTEDEKKKAKKDFLQEMDDYLSGSENAFSTFVSFFDSNVHEGKEINRIKINVIEDKSSIDKDLLTTRAANQEILMSMQIPIPVYSAGGGTYGGGAGSGSDIRESFLVYNASLNLERQIALEPLNLVRDFNEWGPDIVFRVRDTVLTTLDKNSGTKKVLS